MPMPVLPAVDSTTSPPGRRSPRFSASRIIWRPARSFTDWPGFMNSALPRIVQPVASEACRSLISGVWPIASTTSSQMRMLSSSVSRPRLGHDAQVRLRSLPAARVDALRLVVADRARDDHVLAVLPVHRGGDPVLGGELERIDDPKHLVEVAPGGHRVDEHQLD